MGFRITNFSFLLKVTLSAGENRCTLLHVGTAISTSSIARAQRMIGINATIANRARWSYLENPTADTYTR